MSNSNMQTIQHSNYSQIYHLLYQNEQLSKQGIADQLKLSLPTVSANLEKLLDQKLILKQGQLKSTIGRRATAYAIDPDVALSVGIEIFRNQATVSILNLVNTPIVTETLNLIFDNDDAYFQSLSEQLLAIIDQHKIDHAQIIGVGVGVQGLVSNDGTTVLYGKILNCTGMTTKNFSDYLPFPVTFYHDADCVAAAEYAKKPTDGIYLSVSEHLGTAVILNGKTLETKSGRSGTMEHITLDGVNGPRCYCGRRGCIETYCSLSSLLNEDESATDFFAQLQAGDTEVTQRFNVYLSNLARSLYNLHMFIDIPIIIAGDLAKYLLPEHLDVLKAELTKLSVFPERDDYLEIGQVVDHAVASGAAIPAINAYLNLI